MSKRRKLRKIKLPKFKLPFKLKKKKGPRRRVRKSLVVLVILFVCLIVGLFYVPKMIDNGKLKDLGYTKDEITAIRELKLTKEEANVKTPHGHLILENNIKQSRKFLVQSGLLEYTSKEHARITIAGLKMANNS